MIKPKDIASSTDKHVPEVIQAQRVAGEINRILVDYWKMLRYAATDEGGFSTYHFYFSGDIVTGLQARLEAIYLPAQWYSVKVNGWELKQFLAIKHQKDAGIIDIGGNPAHVFEVELTCMNIWM